MFTIDGTARREKRSRRCKQKHRNLILTSYETGEKKSQKGEGDKGVPNQEISLMNRDSVAGERTGKGEPG